MNWNDEPEEQTPYSVEEARRAFACILGKEYLPPEIETPKNQPQQTEPQINFPELENPLNPLAFQQINHAQNPPIPAPNTPQPAHSRSETGFSDRKPARSPYEPQRGPRGFLNELPEATQQRILHLLETKTDQAVIDLLAQPVPEGIGQIISRRSLQRFQNRHRIIEQRSDFAALATAARDLTTDPNTTDADLTNASLRIVRAAVLEFATDIQNFDSLERLNDVLHKLRRADIADRRQTYLEQKESNDSSGLQDRPHKSPGRSPGSRFEAASRSERAQHSIVNNPQSHPSENDNPSTRGN